MFDCDVAIVGYGPTGMMLAALLGRRGHRVIVLERFPDLFNLPRAACFDDEIMRTFQTLGLVDEVASGVVAQDEYDWVNGGGETLVSLNYDRAAPGGWAALYMMYQPHIETVLDRYDKALPCIQIRQGFTVSALAQDENGVTLTGSDTDGRPASLHTRFVVGADGGNGFTRRTLQPSMNDYAFEENWLVCDFEMKRSVPGLPMFRQICDPAHPSSIVRIGPHHHRFSFMLEPDVSPEQATAPSEVWLRVASYLTPDDAELIRAANYMFRSRIANQWRFGRVVLAGDAAHEMPPFLGQGMCSGMRDAHNLAWKFDLILTGFAGADILDTYQAERAPHVRFITEKAIELGRVQTLRDPEESQRRDEKLLERRRAQQAPEKVRLPPLSGGLIANNGSFFPQGRVRLSGREGLFDDVAGYGWCMVAKDSSLLDGIATQDRTIWASLGGQTLALMTSENGRSGLVDLDGVYHAWFDSHGCQIAVVRPDWYVYGTADDADELNRLLDLLAGSLQNETSLTSEEFSPL